MSIALQRFYGIQIESCQNTTIKNNIIQKAAPDPTSTLTNNLFGIFVDMSCTNFKIVNDIYWRTWFIGTYSFSSEDSLLLYDIAYQDPSYGGTAVFSARVMLGIDVENNNTRRSSNSISINNLTETKFARFYPNPAKDYVNYEVTLGINDIAQLEVFDLFGRVIFAKKIDYDSKTGFIDFRDKTFGMYTYKINFKTKVVSGKIVLN